MPLRNKEKIKKEAVYSYGLVFSQLLILALMAMKSQLSVIDLSFTGLGLFISVWSAWHLRRQLTVLPEPVRGKSLIQSGPYKIVRHPIYFAILIWGLGKLASKPSVETTALYLLLFGILILKIRHEESLLLKYYSEYKEYKTKTASLIPFLI